MKEEIKEKILEYLNSTEKKGMYPFCLKVLDNKYRNYYTGVTLNYITYELLKAKYKKSNVAECLVELYENNEIKSLYCGDVKNVVFESKRSPHGTFSSTSSYDEKYTLQYFNNYMNQFINKNNE